MKNVRLALIEELVTRNWSQIKMMNVRASESGQPMSQDDQKRCLELRKANTWLNKAKVCIIKATEGLEPEKEK